MAHGAPPGRIGIVHRLLLLALVAVLIVVGACSIATPSAVSIHAGIASSAEGAISIEADGWTYSVPLDGVAWIDAANTWHDAGRPDCLPTTGATRPITFAAVEVTLEGATWRPVVWVSCR